MKEVQCLRHESRRDPTHGIIELVACAVEREDQGTSLLIR